MSAPVHDPARRRAQGFDDDNDVAGMKPGTCIAAAEGMTFRPAFLALSLVTMGCVPPRGEMPANTWHPDDPDGCSVVRHAPHTWPDGELSALEAALDTGEPVVVSNLGCHLDVLSQCDVEGGYHYTVIDESETIDGRLDLDRTPVRAAELEGGCRGATHVVTAVGLDRETPMTVELTPLSLDGFDASGIWRGVMRQPGGPYEVYDVRMDLKHEGERVLGTTYLSTIDDLYHGVFRFEGRLDGNTVYFVDAELLDEDLGPFLGWCMKGGFMLVEPKRPMMRGSWRAFACMPGSMELTQEI